MKKRYNLIGLLALALTAGITTSCSDFLTQENKKALTEEADLFQMSSLSN